MTDPPEIRVSVCMATYNGDSFVGEQVRSILKQLAPGDELVIVDDASSDHTIEVLAAFEDPRIKLHRQSENAGYVRAFERALSLSKGEYVFLADQDDVWPAGRVEVMVKSLEKCAVVAGNYSVLGATNGRPSRWRLGPKEDGSTARNMLGILVGYRPYFGCGMGLTRQTIRYVLPIPLYFVESHDLWIAMVGNLLGSINHLSADVVQRRLHDHNVTPLGWRSTRSIARARLMLARGALEARRRTRRTGRLGFRDS